MREGGEGGREGGGRGVISDSKKHSDLKTSLHL